MRAALLHAYGAPPQLGERADPVPSQDQTLLHVTAAPIVPLDLLCASGTSYFGEPPLPYVPGVQGVGIVRSSPDLAVGSRVWFATTAGMTPGDGSLAEVCAVGPRDLVPIETTATDAAVAAIGTSGIAAWMSLTWRAGLQPGERVVVLGANGAVGQVAVAVAKALGAGRVVGVVRAHGVDAAADDIVVLEPGEDRVALAARLRNAVGGAVDVVIDPVFGEPAAAAALSLGPWGRLVNIGGTAGNTTQLSSAALRQHSLSILGYTNNAITAEQRAEALRRVLTLAADGAVSVDHRILPLSECAAAWDAARAAGPRVVLKTDDTHTAVGVATR